MRKYLLPIVLFTGLMLQTCSKEEELPNGIIVKEGGKTYTLKVIRPGGSDSIDECIITAMRTASNNINNYRQVAFRIDDVDCGLFEKDLPYTADDFYLSYQADFSDRSYSSVSHPEEVEIIVTKFTDKEVRGTFEGRLYDQNDNLWYVDVKGSFRLPIME